MPISAEHRSPRQRRNRHALGGESPAMQPVDGSVNWRVSAAAGAESIAAEIVQRIEAGNLGGETIIKQGQHRTVYRLHLQGRVLIVKHYPRGSGLRRLGQLFRDSAARREWNNTHEASRRGLATIDLVACLEHRSPLAAGGSYLVSEELADVVSLQDYVAKVLPSLPVDAQALVRRRLRQMLACFTAGLHAAGIDHDDFHAGNILVQGHQELSSSGRSQTSGPDSQGIHPPRLVLIDLPGARLGRPLNWRRSRHGLAMLGTSLWGAASDAERLAFLLAYLRQRPGLVADQRKAISQVWNDTRAHARRILLGRDDRALRNNRDFIAVRPSDGVAHAVSDVCPRAIARLIADPDLPLRAFRHTAIKLSHTSVLVTANLPLIENQESTATVVRIAYKRSRPATWWKGVLGQFRRSRAIEAFRLGHALLQRGIATPRPLAAIDSRCASRRGDCHLAVEWMEGAENLHLFAWRLANGAATERRLRTRQAAVALGHLLGRMHDQRVTHRDLKGMNLILVPRPNDVSAMIVDLDGVRIRRRLGMAQRADDLARLAASVQLHAWITRTDRLRFLRAYLQELPAADDDFKRFWRLIDVRAQSVERRLQASGKARG